jgi:flagellar biosynthesis/type III secretory pathway chaperone
MDERALEEQLAQVIDRQMAVTRSLLDILQTEKAALIGTDPDVLQQIAARKETTLRELAAYEQQRQSLLGTANVATSGTDLRALQRDMAAINPGGPLSQRWQELCELLGLCRDANATNGAIVNLRQRHIRQALNVIRGGRADDLTYGPAGSPTGVPASRGLARV